MELYALYLAYKDPRVPWHARVFAACVVGYAFSPIDLVPDFIPVLGYLDDLVLVPLAMAECRERAQAAMAGGGPVNRVAAAVIVGAWVSLAALTAWLLLRAA